MAAPEEPQKQAVQAPPVGAAPDASSMSPGARSAIVATNQRQTNALIGEAPAQGEQLPAELRAKMERAFSADFSNVTVHQGSAKATAVGARAFAVGNELHFSPGAYDPSSPAGQELIGHELTHVAQQRSGRAPAAPQGKGAPIVQDASLESEADAAGARAARGEDSGIPAGGSGAPAQAVVQGYFTLNQEQLTALWQREQLKGADARASFPGQETGHDVANPKSFTKADNSTNLVTLAQVPSLRVSQDGNMAIEDSDFESRQAKAFFLEPGMVGPANVQLLAVGSGYRLVADGGTLEVPTATGLRALAKVVAQKAALPEERGDALTGPVQCNMMAGAVSGGETHLKPQMNLQGATPGINAQDKSTQMAAYVNRYASAEKKNANRTFDFMKNSAAKQKGVSEAAATSASQVTYDKVKPKTITQPKVEVTVTDIGAFKVQLAIAAKDALVMEEKVAARKVTVLFSSPEQAAVLASVPALALLVTNSKKVGSLDRPEQPKAAEMLVPIEAKQNQIANAYGAMAQPELDNTAQKLGINQFAEPEVGDALEILPVGVPDANKEILDVRSQTKIDASFPYHWGGVVARSGPDYVTLENYARNAEDGGKAVKDSSSETRAYFQMYGSKNALDPETKSFHEFWGKYFANPLTLNHRKK